MFGKLAMTTGALVLTMAAGSAMAATATFQYGVDGYASSVDTFIRRDSSRQDYNNGGATDIQIQSSGAAVPLKQGMIMFDDIFGPGVGEIPTGQVITSATVRVYYRLELIAGGATKTLHTYPILIDIPNYGNGDGPGAFGQVNWTYRVKATEGWGDTNTEVTNGPVADEDYDTSREVLTNYLGSQVNSFIDIDITDIAQDWYDGTLPNYGLIVRPGTGGFEASYFYSNEWGTASQRPQLVINYEPIPEPATIGLLAMGAGLMLYRRRSN